MNHLGIELQSRDTVLETMDINDVYLIHKSSEKSGVTVLAIASTTVWICHHLSLIITKELNHGWRRVKCLENFFTKEGWMTVDDILFLAT